MKKSHLALYLILPLIFCTSCSTEAIDETSAILGQWKLTSWKVNTPIDLDNDGISNSEFSAGCLSDSAISFIDPSNGTIFYSSSVTYNTRMENGQQVLLTACSTRDDIVPSLVGYTMTNNTITLNSNGEEFLLTLNENTLSMHIPNGFVAKDIDTSETTISQDITYVFTR
jgi:hypothetical protein